MAIDPAGTLTIYLKRVHACAFTIVTKWLLFRQQDDYPGVRFQGKRNRVWVLESFKGSLRALVEGLGYMVRSRAC